MIAGMVYESLLTIHPTTLDFIPVLATHWQVSEDGGTYRFRIDPNARWADGQPVTADDVVASWTFLMDKGLQSPSSQLVYGKFEKPVAESSYIVSVKSQVRNWRNFMYFAGSMWIFPAHVLKDVDGAKYLEDYNFKLLPGTGPYRVDEADVDKGNGHDDPPPRRLLGEQTCGATSGSTTSTRSARSSSATRTSRSRCSRRATSTTTTSTSRASGSRSSNFDRVQRGLIQKRKIFNDNPSGVAGLAFNTRKPPFDDIRVRKALTLLQNRQLLIERLFFNEYVPHELLLQRRHLRKREQPEERVRPASGAGSCSPRPAGRIARRAGPARQERPAARRSSCSTAIKDRSGGSRSTRKSSARSVSA